MFIWVELIKGELAFLLGTITDFIISSCFLQDHLVF